MMKLEQNEDFKLFEGDFPISISATAERKQEIKRKYLDPIPDLKNYECIHKYANPLAPAVSKKSYGISGGFLNPFIEVVDERPTIPQSVEGISSTKPPSGDNLRRKQAFEIYKNLVQMGTSQDEALAMMGPLVSEITRKRKYTHSFSISEARWSFGRRMGELAIYDRPFMAPIRR